METIFQSLAELEKNHGSAALCTVVKSEGSTPRHVGSKMLVYPDGLFVGSVGGGKLESCVLAEAKNAIQDGQPRFLHYNMVDPARGDPGLCGGQVEVFVEPILPHPLLLLIGAGHVGKAVVHLAKWLGFRVAVSDDRADLCNPEATPGADAYYPVTMSDLASQIHLDRHTYVVLTTRGSDVDVKGLAPLLNQPVAYVGVIGSQRRWMSTVKELKKQGVSAQALARIHSPIGLELQAETPEEIALSIMAEILMLHNKATGAPMQADLKHQIE